LSCAIAWIEIVCLTKLKGSGDVILTLCGCPLSILLMLTNLEVEFPASSVAINSKEPFSVKVWEDELSEPSSVEAFTVIS
jgi:hypothetical protein